MIWETVLAEPSFLRIDPGTTLSIHSVVMTLHEFGFFVSFAVVSFGCFFFFSLSFVCCCFLLCVFFPCFVVCAFFLFLPCERVNAGSKVSLFLGFKLIFHYQFAPSPVKLTHHKKWYPCSEQEHVLERLVTTHRHTHSVTNTQLLYSL